MVKGQIQEKIESDLKAGLKKADYFLVGVLRLLIASIHNEEISKRGKNRADILVDEIMTDDEVISVLKKEAKKRKEAIDIYSQTERKDLLQKEQKELEIIFQYLPEELEEKVVEDIVKKIIFDNQQTASGQKITKGNSDFGLVMKEVMKELKGKADGNLVSEVVKRLLQ